MFVSRYVLLKKKRKSRYLEYTYELHINFGKIILEQKDSKSTISVGILNPGDQTISGSDRFGKA